MHSPLAPLLPNSLTVWRTSGVHSKWDYNLRQSGDCSRFAMKIQYALKSALIFGTAALLVATCADAAPKKKEQFELFVPIVASQSIKSDQYLGSLSGALSSGEFFDGLQRL